MNDLIQRLLTIFVSANLGIFLISYYPLMFFILSTCFIYGEFLYCLHRGNKIEPIDMMTLSLATISFYSVPIISWIPILLSDESIKVFIYYSLGLLWTYPTIYLSYVYVQNDSISFIVLSTIIWFSDGGAYIFGKTLGKHKLAPVISPNKTVEGAIGGILTSILIAYLFSFYYTKIPFLDLLMLGLLYGIFGTIGDLVESKFKRWVGVKDSGFLMGNSGGILDKTDSLFFAIPVGHLYLTFRGISILS